MWWLYLRLSESSHPPPLPSNEVVSFSFWFKDRNAYMIINDNDLILEWFLEAQIHILFQSVHFPKRKPVWATCQIDWGWCGSHRTSCHPVCYIPVNHVCSLRYFQTSIALFLVIFNGFEVICWLLVGHDILWDCCEMTWNWSSRCLAMPSFPAAFSPLCRCWKHTNTQIHKYTNT